VVVAAVAALRQVAVAHQLISSAQLTEIPHSQQRSEIFRAAARNIPVFFAHLESFKTFPLTNKFQYSKTSHKSTEILNRRVGMETLLSETRKDFFVKANLLLRLDMVGSVTNFECSHVLLL
jgi:hypothetical protein